MRFKLLRSLSRIILNNQRTFFLLRKIIYLASVIGILTILIACSDQQSPLKPLPADATILAFGDSLTFGYGVDNKQSYPSLLEFITGYHVINAGVSGDTTEQALRRLPSLLKESTPKLVIVCLGGNDVLKRVPMDTTAKNLAAIVNEIQLTGAQVILIGVPAINLRLAAPEFYKDVATQFNVLLDNELLVDLLKDPTYKSDSFHLNKEGYRKLAEGIAKLLHDNGAI